MEEYRGEEERSGRRQGKGIVVMGYEGMGRGKRRRERGEVKEERENWERIR